MAQSRERRNQRRKQQARLRPSAPVVSGPSAQRRRNLRRVVIAFLILVGLAGIMTISAPADDPDDPGGAAVPIFDRR